MVKQTITHCLVYTFMHVLRTYQRQLRIQYPLKGYFNTHIGEAENNFQPCLQYYSLNRPGMPNCVDISQQSRTTVKNV